MKSQWLREISFDFMSIPGGEKYARLLLWRAIRESPLDLKSLKHFLRSFAPLATRAKRYKSLHVYEDGIPPEVTDDFLSGIFNGDHHCSFCDPSFSFSMNSGNNIGTGDFNQVHHGTTSSTGNECRN